ncbi:MAG TPA: N,N-dimethylformamidase beta subunit family domain-containing protein [Vicinamibacteria bacterium]|nr:N,N-dimethylformamidase beta subunit family domain-containing protein [Vicinamibacteria bacterium]
MNLSLLIFSLVTLLGAQDPCARPTNAIVAENCMPGSPSTEWDIDTSGDPSIQGFATDISIQRGETIHFKIQTDATDYRIDIYRMGYYGGMGARRVATIAPSVSLPQQQPDCLTDADTRLFDCGNWQISASWRVPGDAVSGIYFARLVREDPAAMEEEAEAWPHAYGALGFGRLANELDEPRASHIYFIVRDDASRSDVLFQTSDTTWQAYNRYGGTSTYGTFDPAAPAERAYKVSYNRPFANREYRAVNLVFNAEYPMVRWLEANGYDVTYATGVDTERRGEKLVQHKLFLSVGHDEYWSGRQRANVEAARDAGVHLGFFSGNEIFWKIRWEPSIDGSGTPHRTLVCYKETHDGRKIDPLPDVWTGTWRDSRPFNPEGAQPENALIGQIFTVNAWRYDPILVPAAYSRLRFWRSTDIARLRPGETARLDGANLGHEWDEDLDNGFRPPGLMHLSETTVDNVHYIHDHGSVYRSGTATHHLTLYRHESGALVFGAGTLQWSWGLDAHHDNETGLPARIGAGSSGRFGKSNRSVRVGVDLRAPDTRVQQATVNLFADMGVQPSTLQPGLVLATPSTDETPPMSTIVWPEPGTVLSEGRHRIRGRASDEGGGVVAGIEVSVDGGQRWHPASGWDDWTYEWEASTAAAPAILRSRAVDDSGNLESPGPGVQVRVEADRP